MITVVGLGPGDPGDLTVRADRTLRSARRLFLRTSVHPTVSALAEQGISFESFDSLYRDGATFDEVYTAIYERLLAEGASADIVYAVPGHPLVGEDVVRRLLAQRDVPVEIVPGVSGLEAMYARLGVDPSQGVQVVDAQHIDDLLPDRHTLVLQVWSRQVASDAKLALMRWFADEHPVTVVRGAGVAGQEQIERVPLYEVDRLPWIDHLTSFYLPPGPLRGVRRLEALMHRLRAPGGCPWDAEQTHESLRRYCIEEAYEVVDAIDRKDDDALEEELGDLLLQVVFHAELAAEDGRWTLHDVAERICDKLVSRHPHVFGDSAGAHGLGASDVLRRWEDIKAREKPRGHGALAGVPLSLPALTASEKLQSRAARVGFEWPDFGGALRKLDEEIQELREALEASPENREAIAHEIGDVLTAVVNLARFKGIDPEQALRDANARFVRRFQAMEALAGGSLEGKTVGEMLELWARAKVQAG